MLVWLAMYSRCSVSCLVLALWGCSTNGEGYPALDGMSQDDAGALMDGMNPGADPDAAPPGGSSFAEIIAMENEKFSNLDSEKQMATANYGSGSNPPIVVSADDELIKDKIIYAGRNDDCGIRINGHDNVRIENVVIYHANAGVCVTASAGLRIDGLTLVSLSAPTTGPHCPRGGGDGLSTEECWGQRTDPADQRLGVVLKQAPDAIIKDIASFQASSGVYAVSSPRTKVERIRCFDMRGPFPRGQCVQFNRSDDSSVTTFYSKGVFDQSHSEDNFNAYLSDNVVVREGLIDGNWSNNGMGVIADRGSDDMIVDDVDFIHISTAAVNVWSNEPSEIGSNFRASKLRVKDTQCYSRQDTLPSTGGLVLAAQPSAVNPVFDDVIWFNHCRATVTWCLPGQACRENDSGSATNIREEDFQTRWTNE